MDSLCLFFASYLFLVQLSKYATSYQKWHYTGEFRNDRLQLATFSGSYLSHDLFDQETSHDSEYVLYGGGMILKQDDAYNMTAEQLDQLAAMCFSANDNVNNTGFEILQHRSYKILVSLNYAEEKLENFAEKIFETEIGLYDHDVRRFLEKSWRPLSLGHIIAFQVRLLKASATETHKLVVSTDLARRFATLSHTWDSQPVINKSIIDDGMDNKRNNNKNKSKKQATLRVMTYNLWHNNPLSWVYSDRR